MTEADIEVGVPVTFTVRQVCEILNIGKSQVTKLIRSGELKSVTWGRSRRVTMRQLLEHIHFKENE